MTTSRTGSRTIIRDMYRVYIFILLVYIIIISPRNARKYSKPVRNRRILRESVAKLFIMETLAVKITGEITY